MAEFSIDALVREIERASADVKAQADGVLDAASRAFASDLQSSYPEVTGALRRGVRVAKEGDRRYRVRTTAAHASIYEQGTRQRRDNTRGNANRGRMPRANVFVPKAIQHRSRMLRDLEQLIERTRDLT